MEFIAGITLAERVRRSGPPDVKEVLRIGFQAARGLAAAHAQGLIHRDITPRNILLENGVQRVKLIDFGLVRAVDDANRSNPGLIAGTPLYMSPEQARGEALDPRSDLFSLGSVLYMLCTGRPAFAAGNSVGVLKRVCDDTPQPIRAVNPEVPDWLAALIDQLMAKDAAARIQSAQELADRLSRHLTSLQQPGPGAPQPAPAHAVVDPRRRFRAAALLGLIVLAAGLILVAYLFRGTMFPPRDEPQAENPNTAPEPGKKPEPEQPPDPPTPPPPVDPSVLTVSKKPEDGGRFRKIQDALDAVKPGMTIRVLDDAVYEEALLLSQNNRHADLTLEAPRMATLRCPAGVQNMIEISGVKGVIVRGFRLEHNAQGVACVWVRGHSPGLILEQLDVRMCQASSAIEIGDGAVVKPDESPVVVQHCRFRRVKIGLALNGVNGYQNPLLLAGVCVRLNTFEDCEYAVSVIGQVTRVQIVGNQIRGAATAAIQLENLMPGAGDILVANNTVFDSQGAVRLWDVAPRGKNIRVCNNLFLGRPDEVDLVFWDSGGNHTTARGAGDGAAVLQAWRWDHNWRELKEVIGWPKGWIPVARADTWKPRIEVLSRDPHHADFLRPAKDSPLATGGAGKDEADLPRYVGAVPPEGAAEWDWDKTWKALSR
jgi:hypothetical protein